MADDSSAQPDLGDLDPTVLARYLTGETSRDEHQRIVLWLAERPEREQLVEQLREVRRVAGTLRRDESYDVEDAWHKVQAMTSVAPTRPPLQLIVRPPASLRTARRIGIAASLLLAVGAGTWFVTRDRPSASAPSAPLREIATRAGQRADVYLSDGTHVILGAGSRIRFASPLDRASREVHLEGEALFEVTHDPKSPFLVRTKYGISEDLGTRFTVRAFDADSAVTVAVAEGSVALRRDATPSVVLGAGDVAKLTATGHLDTERGVALDRYLAWTEGRLVFTDAVLRDVVPDLARWYDLDLRFADPSLAARHLTITATTESTDELLRYIALAVDVRYTRQGRTVTFYAK